MSEQSLLSSPEPTDTHTFLSKDGLYYITYSDYVAANVQYNQRVLKEKGLDQPFRSLSKRSPRKLNVILSDSLVRRSSRLQEGSATTSRRPSLEYPSSPRSSPRLRMDHDFFSNSLPPPKKKQRKIKKPTEDDRAIPLSEEEYHKLSQVKTKVWVKEMEIYLKDVENISHQNLVSVMRQITKLVEGEGITYHNWPNGTYFYEDKKIHLGVDCDQMYDDAVDYENDYGRDKGNGMFITSIFF